MESKIKKCKNLREVLLEQLSRVSNFLEQKKDTATPEEVQVRLASLEKIFEGLSANQTNLENYDETEIEQKDRGNFEETYYSLKPALQVLYSKLIKPENKTVKHDFKPTNTVKLKEIEIETFNGEYTKWTKFYQMFLNLVHNNPSCCTIVKFQHLRNSLSGPAARTIESLEPSEENYEATLQLLKNRYDNRKLIAKSHIRTLLFGIKSLEKSSAEKLRNLIDTFNTHLRSLKSLGRPIEQYEDLIVELLLSKLDSETRTKWDNIAPVDRLESYAEVEAFINKSCQVLEITNHGYKSPITNTTSSNPRKHTLQATLVAPQTTQTFKRSKCPFCERTGHRIFYCKKFRSNNESERLRHVLRLQLCTNCLRPGHVDKDCSSSYCCNKEGYLKRHNTLLHQGETNASSNSEVSSANVSSIMPESTNQISTALSSRNHSIQVNINKNINNHIYVFLATAVVYAVDSNGSNVLCRVLLDSGSQLNFVTTAFAKRLGLKKHKHQAKFGGVGALSLSSNYVIDLTIKSRTNKFVANIEAHTLQTITNFHPHKNIDIADWTIPGNVQLADPDFYNPNQIDVLIGASLYYQLLSIGQIKLSDTLPTQQNTRLGWVVVGSTFTEGQISTQHTTSLHSFCGISANNDISLDFDLERFWKIETLEKPTSTFTIQERLVERHFDQTTTRDHSGKFIVALPFLKDTSVLGNSRIMATKRFYSLEAKLNKNEKMKIEYAKFLEEYEALGHMQQIPEDEIENNNYFMPHHCVIKPESSTTHLRVVFDASAQTTSGYSLNDILMVGPVVQEDLFSILVRFRTYQYVITADISKMYRQIKIQDAFTKFQLIIWRNNQHEDLKVFKLKTLTYGTASAPNLATKCIQKLAIDGKNEFPLANKIMLRDIYVDDLLTGSNSLEELEQIKSEIKTLLNTAEMQLRKFCSNHDTILHNIPDEHKEKLLQIGDGSFIKTLGLYWRPSTDQFSFNVKYSSDKPITKRSVLSDIARIYDPLGLTAPVITLSKIFMQRLWQLKHHWDEALPQELHTLWQQLRSELPLLNNLSLNRHIILPNAVNIQLHGFSDSSEKAYGAGIYARSLNLEGNIDVMLICSKSRIAPLSKTTLPRLELCAAILLVELFQKIKPIININISKTFYWTDSKIVLSWINSESCLLKTFVGNRVAQIQKYSNIEDWRHVSSTLNPADHISRGLLPSMLLKTDIWFKGPAFLTSHEATWPIYQPSNTISMGKEEFRKINKIFLIQNKDDVPDILIKNKYLNNFGSLQKTMAFVIRFIKNCKSGKSCKVIQHQPIPDPSSTELNEALTMMLKIVQCTHFKEEIMMLESGKSLSRRHYLKNLTVFLDNDRLLRVGGRLQQSSLSYSVKHPILLPYGHPFTTTIFNYYHTITCHAGPQALLAVVRQYYWPVKGKQLATKTCNSCIRCFRLRPKKLEQLMGDLPSERIKPAPPFHTTGIDFCGPFYIHHRIRGKAPTKVYLSVFVCFTTKAIHLELVSDLTTSAFIGALKRFIATRGMCKQIFSDNATNFSGANTELHALYQLFHNSQLPNDIKQLCTADDIIWNFAPPSAPHFGGIYEAAVKSAKFHLRRIMGNAQLTYEELLTLIKQVEAVLNSRPITPLSTSPSDLEPLTPGHFLIGRPLVAILEPNIEQEKIPILKRWRFITQLQQHFWSRWSKEYLTSLQCKKKWTIEHKSLKINDLVVVNEEGLPPLKWRMGRVVELNPGPDSRVRVVKLKTAKGIITRPIAKLCLLPEQL